jgi:carbonic anhydrase/acetyltransferase-like protein (isoleucine patch superfamily)
VPLYRLGADAPVVPASAYVSPEAVLIGKVVLGEKASIWSGAVLRGDNEPIVIGDGSNVQEGAVLHTDYGFPLNVGANVTIGHQAMVHGCTIGEGALIGIQAVILNGAQIGKECLVGAGAIVTERKQFADRSLIIGAPAAVKRQLSDEDIERQRGNAAHYAERAGVYLRDLELIK